MTGFELTPEPERSAMEIAVATAAKSVEAAMVIAQRFPRDEDTARLSILRECDQRRLAEDAEYEYPRGGETVRGPSIRLAEMMSRRWGHFDQGVLELDRRGGQSVCLAYAWDLQTNVRDARTFTVKHWRDLKGGTGRAVTSERDVYEVIANQAARRKRAAILALLPGWLVDEAVERCRKTLAAKAGEEPLEVRIERMTASFAELGVSRAMLEARMGHTIAETGENGMTKLRRLYGSLRDGIADVAELFPTAAPAPDGAPSGPLAGMVDQLEGVALANAIPDVEKPKRRRRKKAAPEPEQAPAPAAPETSPESSTPQKDKPAPEKPIAAQTPATSASQRSMFSTDVGTTPAERDPRERFRKMDDPALNREVDRMNHALEGEITAKQAQLLRRDLMCALDEVNERDSRDQ